MLCQFSVKNYKSIRDEITLDMQAANIHEHEERLLQSKDGELFLPVSGIYGPNGGGKSNVLSALYSLTTKVLRPLYATEDNYMYMQFRKNFAIEPFLFSEETKNQPTEFELFFRTDLAEYRYVLHVKKEQIVYESLDRIKLDTNRRSSLFERDEKITMKGDLSKLKITDDLSDTLPLLSYLGIAYKKNEIIHDVLSWLQNNVRVLNYGNPFMELGTAIADSEQEKQLMLSMVEEMNLDIVDFRLEENENNHITVYTKHRVDDYEAELNLLDESSGTKKVFSLIPYIAESLLKGTVLVVDELDAKIHPALLRHIITLFTDKNSNQNNAQLIFTSHDLSTMNRDVFRRDEIWFVAKGNAQNSQLYSLVEFKTENGEAVRNDAKYDKQYLEGRYGADPYLRRIIDWGEING